MNAETAKFIQFTRHPLKFRIFLFTKLPSAFFSGLRVRALDEAHCVVSVPFTWFSKNPFGSTYFACLSMAAEMSTGVLGLMHIHNRKPGVSMLVRHLEASFFKKAVRPTFFTCRDGAAIFNAVEKAILTGESQEVIARSEGLDAQGQTIATFLVTWSFKTRKH